MCAPIALSFPELRDYLHFNADFPAALLAPFATHLQYRLALPWTCLSSSSSLRRSGLAFRAAESLPAWQRRSLLVFTDEFSDPSIFSLWAKVIVSARGSPAWTPNIVFASLVLYLLYLRAGNREMPRFHLAARVLQLS